MPHYTGQQVPKEHNALCDRLMQQDAPRTQRRILTAEEGRKDWERRQAVQMPCNCIYGSCFQPGIPGCLNNDPPAKESRT